VVVLPTAIIAALLGLPLGNALIVGGLGLIAGLVRSRRLATNHHRQPLAAEDLQIFEGAFPGQPVPSGARPPVSRPHHEVAMKLGRTWFWGGAHVPTRLELLPSLLKRSASLHATLLADIPPQPDGAFARVVSAKVRP
jgi:hypothetical protein